MEEKEAANTLQIKEIDSLRGKISELVFDEPTGKMIRKVGMPFSIKGSAVELDSEKLAQYIEQCCNLGAGDASKLSARDFIEAQNRVLSFFGQS